MGRTFGAAVPAVIGAIVAIYIVSLARIDIYNLSWIDGDLSEVFYSWKQYAADPTSSWLVTTWASYPLPLSIALFDPMPILVLAVGPLRFLTPDRTQFIGVYFVITLMLQGVLGYAVMGQIVQRRPSADERLDVWIKILGSLFFVVAPVTLLRFAGHVALSSQWVLVLSIWAVLRFERSSPHKWAAANGLVAFVAAGLNPYLTLMVVLNAGVWALWAGYTRASGPWATLAKIIALSTSAGLGLFVFGFLAGTGNVEGGGGYGHYSMNLLSMIDSNGHGALWPLDIPNPSAAQAFEGFQYPGLGLLLLLLLAIMLSVGGVTKIQYLRPAIIVAVIAYVLALSTTVTFGEWTLFSVDVPVYGAIMDKFRASGRLFWIGVFWLATMGVAAVVSALSRKVALVVLGVLAAIQVVDVRGVAAHVHDIVAAKSRLQLADEFIGHAADADALIVIPPWQCNYQETPGQVRGFEIMYDLALELGLPTNSVYVARIPRKQLNYHCKTKNVLDYTRLPNKKFIYVLADSYYNQYNAILKATHSCTLYDKLNVAPFHICRPADAAPFVPPRAKPGTYSFALGGNGLPGLEGGWSLPEPHGTWATGRRSALTFPVGRLEDDQVASVALSVSVFAGAQDLSISANGRVLFDGVVKPRPGEVRADDVRVTLNPDDISETGYARLVLHHADAVSPLELGLSADERKLSISLKQIVVNINAE